MTLPLDRMIERIVPWSLNGQAQAPFLCTPGDLEDLVTGHLLTMGRNASFGAIQEISVQEGRLSVTLHTEAGQERPIDVRLQELAPVRSNSRFVLTDLRQCADRLTGTEDYWGTHRLVLHGPQGELFREDIGRHNAADKVIGAAVRQGWTLGDCALGATGRISLEILLKAAAAGIPMIFTKKYESDLCAREAERLGIGIASRIQGGEPLMSGALWRFMPAG